MNINNYGQKMQGNCTGGFLCAFWNWLFFPIMEK